MTATTHESYRPGISEVTETVFLTMLGLAVRPVDDGPDGERHELTAAVYYVGDWNGALLLECSLQQATEWGSRLMGAAAPIAVEDARDALGELCNVLAGNLKPLLPPGARLSTPSVVKGGDYTLRVCRESLCERLNFLDASGSFRVTLIIG